jgi:pimeloyl-ACP methyl ester carboxylesterase
MLRNFLFLKFTLNFKKGIYYYIGKTFSVIDIMIFFTMFLCITVAGEDITQPFEIDNNTVLLMHFEDDLSNESQLSREGKERGKLTFVNGIPGFGKALWVDNSQNENQSRVIVPNSKYLNLTGSFTIEGWINPTSFKPKTNNRWSNQEVILSNATYVVQLSQFYEVMQGWVGHVSEDWSNPDILYPYTWLFSERDSLEYRGTIHPGKWYHFTMVRDTVNGASEFLVHDVNGKLIYFDSKIDNSIPTTHNKSIYHRVTQSTNALVIGGPTGVIGKVKSINFYDGLIDEIRISNVVRDYDFPPAIGNIRYSFGGSSAKSKEPLTVSATVVPLGGREIAADGVQLNYKVQGNGAWNSIIMLGSGNTYTSVIPVYPDCSINDYYISAENKNGNRSTKPVFQVNKPIDRIIEFYGTKRKYFIRLPEDFHPDSTYWPLVVVHGGGGRARMYPKAIDIRRIANDLDLPAIVISPRFKTGDKQASRFPVLGEGAFLKRVLKQMRMEFRVKSKILLMGYSMGGQFAHRFALSNPDIVQACAAFAAGTWSTPDGRLLIEGYGEVVDPKLFLSLKQNASKVPERLRNFFNPRTVEIVDLPAAKGALKVPFLIMCGTLDPRLNIAKEFAKNMQNAGFIVETEWPYTPHGSKDKKYKSEFEKYPKHAVKFFLQHIHRE